MISELRFASSYQSLWRTLLPTAEVFIRKLNLSLYEPLFAPLQTATSPERRGLINEAAFLAFGKRASQSLLGSPSTSEINDAISEARVRLREFADIGHTLGQPVSEDETEDVAAQVARLGVMMAHEGSASSFIFDPLFPGCGFVEEARGDILANECLYEVKAGERAYRSHDIRQILIYLALNFSSNRYQIARVGLLNPRQGTRFIATVEALCQEVAGLPTYELLSQIVYAVSSGDVSR